MKGAPGEVGPGIFESVASGWQKTVGTGSMSGLYDSGMEIFGSGVRKQGLDVFCMKTEEAVEYAGTFLLQESEASGTAVCLEKHLKMEVTMLR